MNKQYLGDGVYICYDGFHFVLTTENGISVTNKICLDGETIKALIKYIEKHEAKS
jgi:hypothetical protein